jgi:hypothetical protein
MSRWDGQFEVLARSEERRMIGCAPHEKEALRKAAQDFADRRGLHLDPNIKADGVELRFFKTGPKE